jgi:hypothetical protein
MPAHSAAYSTLRSTVLGGKGVMLLESVCVFRHALCACGPMVKTDCVLVVLAVACKRTSHESEPGLLAGKVIWTHSIRSFVWSWLVVLG